MKRKFSLWFFSQCSSVFPLLLLGVYGIYSGPRMTFLTIQDTDKCIHCCNYLSTTLLSRNVDALSKTLCATASATCPTTRSTSSIYRQNNQWSNSWYSWRARYWNERSQDATAVGWSCGTHVRRLNPKTVDVWRAHNLDKNCRLPTYALEGLTKTQSNMSTKQWQDTATARSTWRRSVHDGLML